MCLLVCYKAFLYLFETEQEVSCPSERAPLGAYGSGDDVTEMPQLVAPLDNESQGVVVVGGQLVTMQDHHLSTSHLLLIHRDTNTHQGLFCFLSNTLSHVPVPLFVT